MTDTLTPVVPSLVIGSDLRVWLIDLYTEIADTERDDLKRPAEEAYARQKIARLEAEGPLTLAEILEGAA